MGKGLRGRKGRGRQEGEGERRLGSEEVRGLGQRSWSQRRPARKQTNLGLQVHSPQVLLLGCWELAALAGTGLALQCSEAQIDLTGGPASLLLTPPLPSSAFLLGEVGLKWTLGKASEIGKIRKPSGCFWK